jgi:hypothetical protein
MKSIEQAQEQLKLIDEFRSRVHQLNRRLAELDLHGVNDAAYERDFWQRLIIDVADLSEVLRRIAKMRGGSARDRMLRYLQTHVGETVEGATLAAVAGVLDWARRLRELHEELGYQISTSKNEPRFRPGQYRLDALEPVKPTPQ